MSKIYAQAPEGINPSFTSYLTSGVLYEVLTENKNGGFYIRNDYGTKAYCLWGVQGCAHLGSTLQGQRLFWTRIEEPGA